MKGFPWRRILFASFSVGAASGAGVAWTLLDGEFHDAKRIFDISERPPLVSAATSELMRQQQIAASQLGMPSANHLLYRSDYILAYDRRHRSAAWVFEHLTPGKLSSKETMDRSKCEFTSDISQPFIFRAENADYKSSGYDRGHLAAAGNHRLDLQSCQETFLLSNIAPQVGVGFNRHAWNDLEKYVRSLARRYANVYVLTGPLFLPTTHSNGRQYVNYEVIGANQVSVPTHFFKVILIDLSNGYFELLSYVMPNAALPESVKLDAFLFPLDAIQRASGLLFFERLPTNRILSVNKRRVQ